MLTGQWKYPISIATMELAFYLGHEMFKETIIWSWSNEIPSYNLLVNKNIKVLRLRIIDNDK